MSNGPPMKLRLILAFVLALGAFALLAWGTEPATVAEVAWEGERVRNQVARMTPGEDWVDQVVAPWAIGLEDCEPFSLELDPDTLETLVIDDEDVVCGGIYTGIGRPESSRVLLWIEPDAELFHEPPVGRMQSSGMRSGSETDFSISGFEKLPSGYFQITVTNGGTNVEAEIFAFAMTADLYSVTNVWTNDENVVTTLVSTVYSNWSPSLSGFTSAWTRVAAHVPLTDGVGAWTDTSVPPPTAPIRFYAATLRQDSDGDGLTDGEELFVHHTNPTNDISQEGGWADVDAVTFGMPSAGSAVYHFVSNGVGVTWTNNLKADWDWGRSIGSNASLTISLSLTNGIAVWASFCDRAGVAESFEVSVTNALVAYRTDGQFSSDNLPITRLLLVPTNDLPMQVNIHDNSQANVAPNHWGADVRGAFLPVELDLEVGGTPEILEDQPGSFVMDRQVYTNAHLTPYVLVATWLPALPGEIALEGMGEAIRLFDPSEQEEAESHITWDDPVKVGLLGGYGATSVVLRAVWNLNTNVCDEAQVTSTQIRLEPVTIEGGLPPWNPCGIVLGSNALFHVDILPTNVPESEVAWQIVSGGVEFVENVSTGRTVSVQGNALGGFGLTVNVGDAFDPVPHIEGEVLAPTTVDIYLFIVRDDLGGNAPMTEGLFHNMLNEVNQLYQQAGISFQITGTPTFTNRSEWLQLPYGTPDGDARRCAMQSIAMHTGGLEVYCVEYLGRAGGITRRAQDATAGIAIATNANARTLAHEFGHASGLCDIYDDTLQASVGAEETRCEWLPLDWSGDSSIGYYSQYLEQVSIIRRLLMFGYTSSSKVDIPSGRIYGLNLDGMTNIYHVGLPDMNRTPSHW